MKYEYDASGEKCPLPLVKLRVMLKKMKAGDCCQLLLTDSGSKSDIPKFLQKLGHHVVIKERDNDVQELIIQIR
ncbi:sulfurtransferase TusA family protein [Thalassotalea euphylliae]|uniref:sulfurtransferase TusA family protein n=1 Tax=Thalassotalea euphylliae TaxID=1655234 RepID=UPI00363EDCB4